MFEKSENEQRTREPLPSFPLTRRRLTPPLPRVDPASGRLLRPPNQEAHPHKSAAEPKDDGIVTRKTGEGCAPPAATDVSIPSVFPDSQRPGEPKQANLRSQGHKVHSLSR